LGWSWLASRNETDRKLVQKCLGFPLDIATYRWAATAALFMALQSSTYSAEYVSGREVRRPPCRCPIGSSRSFTDRTKRPRRRSLHEQFSAIGQQRHALPSILPAFDWAHRPLSVLIRGSTHQSSVTAEGARDRAHFDAFLCSAPRRQLKRRALGRNQSKPMSPAVYYSAILVAEGRSHPCSSLRGADRGTRRRENAE
jgi:hypothetical protein